MTHAMRDPADYPTAAMPVTSPGPPSPRPYVPHPGGVREPGAGALPPWRGEPLDDADRRPAGSAPLDRGRSGASGDPGPAFGADPGDGFGDEHDSEHGDGSDPERVTVGDVALARRLAEVDPQGTASHVELAVAARRWFDVNAPRRWPVEPKVLAATLGAFTATALVALLERAQDNAPALAGVPAWVGPVLAVVAPPLLAFLRGYAAPHAPRVVEGSVADEPSPTG